MMKRPETRDTGSYITLSTKNTDPEKYFEKQPKIEKLNALLELGFSDVDDRRNGQEECLYISQFDLKNPYYLLAERYDDERCVIFCPFYKP